MLKLFYRYVLLFAGATLTTFAQDNTQPSAAEQAESIQKAETVANDVDEETEPSAFYDLPEFVVTESRVAREQPISTFPMPISALTYEPQVDVQARTISEAQGDVSIRGGTFEQTGFNIGAAGLWDPQTGHYFAEIPVTPNMLSRPVVYTGLDNALYGFNSTAGTIQYDWLPIAGPTAVISGGAGNNGLLYGSAYGAVTAVIPDSEFTVGIDGEFAGSSASGPRDYSGSEFVRYNGRIQLLGPQSQTDFFFGYQSKQFGWPQLYVSTRTFNEQENLQSNLFELNHKQNYGEDDYVQVTGYARRNKDFYVLEQTNPSLFNAQHQSWVFSGAVTGKHSFDLLDVRYMTQYAADSINSTNLYTAPPYRPAGTGNGRYSQSLYKLTVLPERTFSLSDYWDLTVQAGGTFDYSNRRGSAGSPLAGATFGQVIPGVGRNLYYLSFAKTTQVPTGTAVGASSAGGLFRGNPGLGRENSNNVEIGVELERGSWNLHTAVFYRKDNHLTDWAFSTTVPAARFATPVDVDTLGVELIGTKSWDMVDVIAGYTYLNKDENYSIPNVDASFYSGNYAKHRLTLATVWRVMEQVEIRADNELRFQAPNSIRQGTRNPLLSSIGIFWFPPQVPQLEVSVSVDNIFNQSYEEVPGVPGYGRQISAGAALRF